MRTFCAVKQAVTKGQILCESTHLSTRVVKFIETENRMVGAQARGQGDGESRFNADRISIWENEKNSRGVGGDGCTTM